MVAVSADLRRPHSGWDYEVPLPDIGERDGRSCDRRRGAKNTPCRKTRIQRPRKSGVLLPRSAETATMVDSIPLFSFINLIRLGGCKPCVEAG